VAEVVAEAVDGVVVEVMVDEEAGKVAEVDIKACTLKCKVVLYRYQIAMLFMFNS
jgi:hypothetical protein